MTLALPLTRDQEVHLTREAARAGMPVVDYALRQLFGDAVAHPVVTARALLAMAPRDRAPYLEAAAEALAEDYGSDLSRPSHDRELTAFTSLDGDPVRDDG